MDPEYRDYGRLAKACDIWSGILCSMAILFNVEPLEAAMLLEGYRNEATRAETLQSMQDAQPQAGWHPDVLNTLMDLCIR